jgi:Phospholipid-binding protein
MAIPMRVFSTGIDPDDWIPRRFTQQGDGATPPIFWQHVPEGTKSLIGIGPIRRERMVTTWADQKVIREIMLFLHTHGVGTARAVRIFKTYGIAAVRVMS